MSHVDFFEWWRGREAMFAAKSARGTLVGERYFWEQRAATYDEVGSLARAAPTVVQHVVNLVPPGATVLEIGPGTGEFTLPVARVAERVTAIDLSAHMLKEMRRKLYAEGIANVTSIVAEWEDADVSPHDIVLSINSLYRLWHPRAALSKMVECATRRGIIVVSVGANPAPPPDAMQQFGAERYRKGSNHGLLVAGLGLLGVMARVEILDVPRTYRFPSIDAAAMICLPSEDRSESDWEIARSIVEQSMELEPDGHVTHQYDGQVAVIIWEASEATNR